MTVAAVPLNRLSLVKSRLKDVVRDRPALALRLLQQVVATLQASGVVERVAVVSPQQDLGPLCCRIGAHLLAGPGQELNADLELARRWALDQGASALLVALGDLPRIRPDEVRAMVGAAPAGPGVVLAPDRTEHGTNLLFCRPPGAIGFGFGPGSLRRHRDEAERRGLPVRIFHSPGTSQDLDTPEHLEELVWALD